MNYNSKLKNKPRKLTGFFFSGSMIIVSALYIIDQRKVSYNRLSGFKIHFQRKDKFETSSIGSNSSMGNNIYKDNPTTVPINTLASDNIVLNY